MTESVLWSRCASWRWDHSSVLELKRNWSLTELARDIKHHFFVIIHETGYLLFVVGFGGLTMLRDLS